MTRLSDPTEPVLACNLAALGPDERALHSATTMAVLALIGEIQELPDGYAFRLPTSTESLCLAAAFIANERRCCPFFRFVLEAEPEHGPLWLHLTGPAGVKPLIQAELGPHLEPTLARAAGLTPAT